LSAEILLRMAHRDRNEEQEMDLMTITRPARSALLGMAVLSLAACAAVVASSKAPSKASGWTAYEADAGSTHFSPLTQIDRQNVGSLRQAWLYPMVDVDLSVEPLVLGDQLIAVGEGYSIVAIDPGDGRELWRTAPNLAGRSIRGFSFWKSADGAQQRVIFVSGNYLKALDPATGRLIPDFEVDLREGLGRDPQRIRVSPATPGRIFENLIIVGSITGESYESPPGDVRAYDVLTGKPVWSFHTIPRPGDLGYDTWPADAWKTAGAANVWGGLSVDEGRGIAYFVTGSPAYDFYGADRKGDNLFGNSIVAVEARTGKYLWHFQTVHHDLWDYDLVAAPTLMTVSSKGKPVPAVAVATKHGFLFLFDRVTGKPLFPIEERPVPASDVPGEHASPTQPYSLLPPFARQSFTEADIDPALPEQEQRGFIARMRSARNEGLFTPPSLRGTVQMPGNHGGSNWGQQGADRDGRFFVVSFDLPAILQLREPPDARELAAIAAAGGRGAVLYAQSCALCHGPQLAGQAGAPALTGITQRLAYADLRTIIRGGRATMPAFPEIGDGDLSALIDFLKTDGRSTAPSAPGQPEVSERPALQSGTSPDGSIRYRSDFGQLVTSQGSAAIKPPWQTLTAYNLNTGQIIWKMPVGTMPGRSEPTGMPLVKGGLIVTASGLVFVASEADRKLHAYDSTSGRELWSGALPSHPRGGLVTYLHQGRQFIVVPAGFGGYPLTGGTPEQRAKNAYVAFALPQ
jgi:quinoprotein glucose dehydrogenase